MPNDERDEASRDLIKPDLYELFRREIVSLDGRSCGDLLSEQIEDRWGELASESCRQNKRVKPNDDDALQALDAIRFKLLYDKIDLPNITLPQVWRTLRMWSLRRWRTAVPVLLAIATILFSSAWSIYVAGVEAGNKAAAKPDRPARIANPDAK